MIVDQWAVGIVHLDPSAIRATSGIERLSRALLRFELKGGGGPVTVGVHAMRPSYSSWDETHVTWNCPHDDIPTNSVPDCTLGWSFDAADPAERPFVETPTDTVTLAAPAYGDVLELDVTDDVVRILDGDPSAGWVIRRQDGSGGDVTIATNENTYKPALAAPRLELQLEDASFVPTGCTTLPALDDSQITRVADVVEPLYDPGTCQVQLGTSTSVLEPDRVAHLRGKVIDATGAALSGVHVRIVDHYAFGWTASRADGMWDLVVNGGGRLVVEFSKDGYLTVQRRVEVIRNDYVVLDDVVLLAQQDESACMTVSGGTGGFYLGPVETDSRGTRRLGMYFPSAPTTVVSVGGSAISDYCVCSVEYTVDRASGATGARSMPGELPPPTGYTYATELQLRPYDAMAGTCGETPFVSPTFQNSPIFAYVLDHDESAMQDFLGFDVSATGTHVPSGHYDEETSAWIAEPDGRVIQIVDNGSGGCAFDVNDDGTADTSIDGDPAHDVTAAELSALAAHCGSGLEFDIGDRVWRIPVYHFSPSDWNWAVGFLGGALFPFLGWLADGMTNDGCSTGGSIIGCEDQTLGEAIPIAGTPWALHYQSERQRGRRTRYELDIPFRGRVLDSGSTCTADSDCSTGQVCGADRQCATAPVEVRVEIQVGGHRYDYGPLAYSTGSFHFDAWDGTDAWGRLLQGAVPVTVRLGYFYNADYVDPSTTSGRTFGMPPAGNVSVGSAGKVGLWTTWRGVIGGWDQGSVNAHARGQGLGGWSITPHHVYDARAGILYRGDGTQLSTRGLQPTIETLYDGSPIDATGVAMAADGTIYFTSTAKHAIYRLRSDGTVDVYAGIPGTSGGHDDAKLSATFNRPIDIAITRRGDILILEGAGNRLRRISGEQVTTVDLSGVGGLSGPTGIALGPDDTVYIADKFNDRIVAVEPGGGRASLFASLYRPAAIAVDEVGAVFVATYGTSGSLIQRVSPSATGGTRIRTIAGGGTCPSAPSCPEVRDVGDGGPATAACITDPRALSIGSDGSIYVATWRERRIRRIAPDGVIETFAGRGGPCSSFPIGDGGPATSARLDGPTDVYVAPNGHLLIADANAFKIRDVRPALPDAVVGESIVREPDGSLIYRFDERGRHVATQHGLTGTDLLRIEYEGSSGLVNRIAMYGGGPNLSIERDATTLLPTRLNSGFGQTTDLSFDADGYVKDVRDPVGRTHWMTYYTGTNEAGLLETFMMPDERLWEFNYYDGGRLVQDRSPTIAQTLTRRECGIDYACDSDVTRGWGVSHAFKNASWQSRVLDVWQVGDGALRRRVTEPTGARSIWELGDLDGTLSAPTTGGATESVAITQLVYPADGSTISIATGADPRAGFDDYARAVRMRRGSGITTNVTLLREVPAGAPNDLNHTITVNGTRTTTVDVHIDDTTPACVEQRTITSPAPEHLVTTICADAYGRVRSISAPGFEPIDVQYNATTGGVSTVTQGLRETQVSYAVPGGGTQAWPRTVSTMDAPGGTAVERLTYTRDAAGWIDQIDHSGPMASSTLQIGRDPRGRITSLTLPSTQVHDLAYTPDRGLQRYAPPTVTSTSPGGALDVSAWDAAERPEDLRVMNGFTVVEALDYGYDATYGYLQQIGLGGSRSLVITRNTTTTPDSVRVDGRIASLVLDGATTTYTYDGPYLDTETWTGTVEGTVDRDIDEYGELFQLTVGGAVLSYEHDAEGRLRVAEDLTITPDLADEGLSTEHWQRMTTLGSGTNEISSGEVLNRYGELDSLDVDHATAGLLYSYAVTARDELGRETARDEQMAGETAQSFTFGYDGENRLETVTIGGTTVASYGYDANGNRTSATYAGAWSAIPDVAHTTYDAQDRLIQYGDTSLGDAIECAYTYAASGQLATRDCGSGTETYDYDLLGNLLSVGGLPSGHTIDYDVDGRGRRIRRRVMSGGLAVEEQRWLYLDGLNPVAELVPSNAITRIFVYGTRANIPDYMIEGSTLYRFIADPRGSLRAVVDASGTVVQRMQYDAFGNVIDDYLASGFDPVPFGFAGGLYDRETKLVRFGARDYDPLTGRWTAKDPILFDGSTNLYSYVGDPINRVDLSGLKVAQVGVQANLGVVGGGGISFGIALDDANDMAFYFTASRGFEFGASVGVGATLSPEINRVSELAGPGFDGGFGIGPFGVSRSNAGDSGNGPTAVSGSLSLGSIVEAHYLKSYTWVSSPIHPRSRNRSRSPCP